MDFNTLNKQRKFIMIAAVIGLIACFLPWLKTDAGFASQSHNGLSFTGGIIVFIAFIACGVLAFLGDQKASLPKNSWLIVLAAAAASLLIIILVILTKGNAPKIIKPFVKVSIGSIIALLAAGGALASAYMFKGAGQDLKQSLNEMKKNVTNKLDGDPNT